MTKYDDYLSEVAAQTMRDGGSASKPSMGKFLPAMDVWSFPKYPARTAILPPTVDLAAELRQFILRNEAELNEDDCWLGTWIFPPQSPRLREFSSSLAR